MKDRLMKLIEHERTYLENQEDGSEEYCKSLRRVMDLEKQLFELETSERESQDSKKDKVVRNFIEGVKIGTGVVMPLVGLVWITAVEKDTTFTGALRDYTKYFLPGKK